MTESSSATAAIDNDEGAKTRKGHEYESRLHQGQNIGELKAVVGKDVRYEYIRRSGAVR